VAKATENKEQNTKQETYLYLSHTTVRFTHNQQQIVLQYGSQYKNLPADSSIIKNLIHQKKLIKQ